MAGQRAPVQSKLTNLRPSLRPASCAIMAAVVGAASLLVTPPAAATSPTEGFVAAKPVGNHLHPLFRQFRKDSFVIDRLTPVSRPLQLSRGSYMQSVAIAGNRIIVAGTVGYTANVALTMFNFRGRAVGSMLLRNVGHGAMTATRHGGDTIVWLEADPDRRDFAGRGRSIARIVFRNRQVLRNHQLQRFRPDPRSTNVSPTIDWATKTLGLRYRVDGRTYFTRYDLGAAKGGEYAKVSDVLVPLPCSPAQTHGVIQGWAASGDYIYCLQGPKGGPAFLTWANPVTQTSRHYRIRAGVNRYAEPEGLSVAHVRGKERVVLGVMRQRKLKRRTVQVARIFMSS